jgi:hypothetical protein
VFPVRYGLNLYIRITVFRRNSMFEGLTTGTAFSLISPNEMVLRLS